MLLLRKYVIVSILFVCSLVAPSLANDGASSTPNFVPNQTLMLKMRDGTALPTDIYLPPDHSKKYPVILLRNPSGRKASPWIRYAGLAQAGFIVAFQDTRSVMDLEGKTMPYFADGWGELQDGYDSVEALAKYEYSNGKVGTAGFSAPGVSQHMLAPTAPPSLQTQYIGVAAPSLYHHAVYPGGCLQKSQVEGWLGQYAKDPSMNAIILKEKTYNDFWKNFNMLEVVDQVKTPALLYGGWYDIFLQGTIDAFIARQELGGEGARGKQKLLIGPWTHFWPQNIQLGDFEVPVAGRTTPWDMSPLAWFNYYLKNIPTGVEKAAPVTYYVMGPFDGTHSKGNIWKSANSWPVPAKSTPFYFAKEGKLQKESPAPILETLSYTIDPENPIPTTGGCNLFLEAGPKDQRPIEARTDVVHFTSEPLAEDLEVTGRLIAKIYHQPLPHDVDIMVRLTDVYPDGKSILIADGVCHVPKNTPGIHAEAEADEVDLWSTSMVFAKGHCLRVSVCGSNYPRYEKPNLPIKSVGVGSQFSMTLFTGGKAASHIMLPIVEN